MGIIRSILIGVLLLSLITFVALFGRLPAFRKGPIGLLHRFIMNSLPSALCRIDDRLMRGRITRLIKRSGHYLMNENHPFILIFFLTLLIASQLLFLPSSFSRLSSFHRVLAITLCVIPHFFIYKTIKSTSSYITNENHAIHMQKYPYDHVLFQPGRVCRTCRFLKPARSRHCSICKVCVAKHDHHCVWVMNCIGRSNYAYFIGMLLSLAVLLTYGGYDATTGENWSARLPWGSYFDLWLWAISEDIRIGGVGMLAALTAPLAWGLFSYHVYLIWAGMTTSETSKWADWKDDIADGLVFKRKRRTRDSSGGLFDTDIEPVVNWPASNDQWLMRCDDGQPPDEEVEIFANPTRERMVSQKPDWKRVESLTEVDNLYDLGFWANIADIIPT